MGRNLIQPMKPDFFKEAIYGEKPGLMPSNKKGGSTMNNGIFSFEDKEDVNLPSNPRVKKAADEFYKNNREVLREAALSLNPIPEIERNIVHLEPGEVCAKDNCDYKNGCSGLDSERGHTFTCDVESLRKISKA